MSNLHFFGVRHHGPGCARSLRAALRALQPDCVLVEGPPEADALVPLVVSEGMQTPVALLSYCPDETGFAVYHPFAEFSPEWQALQWAARAGVPLRFIDLPRANDFGLDKARKEAAASSEAVDGSDLSPGADPAAAPVPMPDGGPAPEALDTSETRASDDPLSWLARAAGFDDGEAWWNQMVEERGVAESIFPAISEAMVALRQELGDPVRDADEALREQRREAHMRQCIRAAQKEGFERIAVVCGAWHLAGLQADVKARDDAALLKGLPKLKVQTTWVPWSYRHLTLASGYGAGIHAPGWYEHLWRSEAAPLERAAGWLARIARLMRERDLDCSSAHLIEATRLAEALAALRARPAPGLEELQEATRAVFAMGDDTVLTFIRDELLVGDRLGTVPASVPTVPLQRDLEQAQKSLRLKPEATQKTLDLDLRQPNDLARSQLLHRLSLMGIPWGSIATVGRTARGSFHEIWTLQWQPEFALRVIEASRWGQTIAQAACATTVDRCAGLHSLADLAALVDSALLADLQPAVTAATRALQDRAALTGDAAQLLSALPPLANVFRYGNVRGTDAGLVAQVLDGLILRAAIGLPLAARALDDNAAHALREHLLAAHQAIGLRDSAEQTSAWQQALRQLAAATGVHPLLQGLCLRLLLEAGVCSSDDAAQAMSLHLSRGADPAQAAAWLDGFLNRNATVLLHDATVWRLLDAWLSALSDDHFLTVLPLVRRSFSAFGASERNDLARRASQGVVSAPVAAAHSEWDADRARQPLPLLRQLMGLMP
jgi:hypothetical protein